MVKTKTKADRQNSKQREKLFPKNRSSPRQKNLKAVKKITGELLNLMGMEKAKVEPSQEGETIKIDIVYPDPGVLIGNRGETISSLQLILALIVYKFQIRIS